MRENVLQNFGLIKDMKSKEGPVCRGDRNRAGVVGESHVIANRDAL